MYLKNEAAQLTNERSGNERPRSGRPNLYPSALFDRLHYSRVVSRRSQFVTGQRKQPSGRLNHRRRHPRYFALR